MDETEVYLNTVFIPKIIDELEVFVKYKIKEVGNLQKMIYTLKTCKNIDKKRLIIQQIMKNFLNYNIIIF